MHSIMATVVLSENQDLNTPVRVIFLDPHGNEQGAFIGVDWGNVTLPNAIQEHLVRVYDLTHPHGYATVYESPKLPSTSGPGNVLVFRFDFDSV